MKMTAQHNEVLKSARRYHASGFSLIPCRANKKPSGEWMQYTVQRASLYQVESWIEKGIQSIGVIGGAISGNVVFIDLDGIPAIQKFALQFPNLCENTRSILTGSQKGIHLYVRVDEIPDNINVRVKGVGGFEIRANGQYVIAPPSPHPSGHNYRVYRDKKILHVPHIQDVRDWMENMRVNQHENQNEAMKQHARPQNVTVNASKRKYLNTIVSQEIARVEKSSQGNRNNSLFYAGMRLANLCAGGELNWSEMSALLHSAGMSTIKNQHEVEKTIASAWNIGSKRPRSVS